MLNYDSFMMHLCIRNCPKNWGTNGNKEFEVSHHKIQSLKSILSGKLGKTAFAQSVFFKVSCGSFTRQEVSVPPQSSTRKKHL